MPIFTVNVHPWVLWAGDLVNTHWLLNVLSYQRRFSIYHHKCVHLEGISVNPNVKVNATWILISAQMAPHNFVLMHSIFNKSHLEKTININGTLFFKVLWQEQLLLSLWHMCRGLIRRNFYHRTSQVVTTLYKCY